MLDFLKRGYIYYTSHVLDGLALVISLIALAVAFAK